MKKSILILTLLAFALTLGAQPNQRLQELERTLKELGFGVYHSQRTSRGIEHRWTVHVFLSDRKIRLGEFGRSGFEHLVVRNPVVGNEDVGEISDDDQDKYAENDQYDPDNLPRKADFFLFFLLFLLF